MMERTLDPAQARFFRLENQGLARRLPPGSPVEAAAACGLQNTPPGSATLALLARVADLSQDQVTNALEIEKNLLQAWSLRLSPTVFPTADSPIFTLSLLPANEADLRSMIPGVIPALEQINICAEQVVEQTAIVLWELLADRELTKDELGVEIARMLLPGLSPTQQEAWQSPSVYAAGQTLGESVVRFALPIVSLSGVFCHAERRGGQALLARTDRWLGSAPPQGDQRLAQAELVRRFLHVYGPSTAGLFAHWAAISTHQASLSWDLISEELEPVNMDGRRAWILASDQAVLFTAQPIAGVRLLPPHDPYLNTPDRQVLLPDIPRQRLFWRTVGNPGAVLCDGTILAAWRSQKKGVNLHVQVQTWEPLPAKVQANIEDEAGRMADFRSCTRVEVQYETV